MPATTWPETEPRYFGGHLRAQVAGAGVTLSEVEYAEVRSCPAHTHGRAFFAMVLRGGYRERFRTFQLDFRPFQVAFHPEGTQHADEVAAAHTSFLIVELDGRIDQSLAGGSAPSSPRACSRALTPPALRLLDAVRSGDPRDDLAAEGAVLDLLGGLTADGDRQERRQPRWVTTVQELIRSEAARPLTLAAVARHVDLHPVYLSRAFRRFVGMGLPDYVREVRVQLALAALANEETPLIDVALLAGFSDQSRMTRVLRAATGMTPARLRALSSPRRHRATAR